MNLRLNSFAILLALAAQPAVAAFLTPDSTTSPFEEWTRSDVDSSYAEWDEFSDPAGPNPPDVGAFGPTTADLIETGGNGAFITSGGNIYSFSGATDFEVSVPAYNYGSSYTTRVVMQIRTLGNGLDLPSVVLSYDGLAQGLAPDYTTELARTALGGFGGVEIDNIFAWDVLTSPGDFQIGFSAAGTSMSLDRLVVDTFAHTGDFSSYPAIVPEPTAIVLVGFALCGGLAMGLRRRFDQAANRS